MAYISNRFNDPKGLGIDLGQMNKSGTVRSVSLIYSTSTMLFATYSYAYPLQKKKTGIHLLGQITYGHGSMPYARIPNSSIGSSVFKNNMTTVNGGVRIGSNWKKDWVAYLDIYGCAGIIYGEGFDFPNYSIHKPLSFFSLNIKISIIRQFKL